MRAGIEVTATPEDRRRLEAIVRDRNAAQKHVARAKVILATADGCGTMAVMSRSGLSKPAVWRWQERFMHEGVDGLLRDKTRPSGKPRLPDEAVRRVLDLTLSEPPGEAAHWTGRMMAKASGVSLRSVQRIWAAHGLEPHRIRTFKLSRDPQLAERLKDVVGLYVDPPAHAVVLSVDEKSQIQALDRTQPGLALKPGRPATMTYDYKRHGTTTLFAALNVLEGTVLGRHAAPSPSGVHPLPERPRGDGPCRADRACDPGQLRHPQAPAGAGLAPPSSPLRVPLHPDRVFVAQCGRDLLCRAHETAAQARGVPLNCRPPGRHPPLHR